MSKSSDWARNLQPIEPGPEHHVIADLAARLAKAERERDAERQDRWATRAQLEDAEASLARMREALEEAEKVIEPFAATAEHDIGESETDDDMFRPMLSYNRAPRLTIGHLRAARKWMEERPAPSKEG